MNKRTHGWPNTKLLSCDHYGGNISWVASLAVANMKIFSITCAPCAFTTPKVSQGLHSGLQITQFSPILNTPRQEDFLIWLHKKA